MSGLELERYLADVRERPLVIEPRRPWYSIPMCAVGGFLIGMFMWWSVITGVLLLAAWWFGIASHEASSRRYERARTAAIHERYRELGIEETA